MRVLDLFIIQCIIFKAERCTFRVHYGSCEGHDVITSIGDSPALAFLLLTQQDTSMEQGNELALQTGIILLKGTVRRLLPDIKCSG